MENSQQVDISTITDEKELKAIAFDLQIQASQTQQQLQLVLGRLQQVQTESVKKSKPPKK